IDERMAYENACELQVKYAIRSCSFSDHIRSGIGISKNNPIYDAWITRVSRHSELPGCLFNLSTKKVYHADIFPQGNIDTVMILMWHPHR
ncbi:hypothetical protein, partial [Candidatus Entotheonella palauensis]|uniref:hypothetical protein n=1 Tax=Candidatus Entotheonella palauensis TaxID=93172 RepID=UPI001C4E2698